MEKFVALQVVQTETDAIGFSFSSSDEAAFTEYLGWCEMSGIGLVEHDYVDVSGIRHFVAVGRAERADVVRMKLRWGSYQQ